MNFKFKTVLLSLLIIIQFITLRPFGNVLHDLAAKYEGTTIQELRRFEKLKNNVNKAELDVNFLTNCRTFDVTPKFLLIK